MPQGELYDRRLIDILERLWGDGWLSPGGAEELARLLDQNVAILTKMLPVLDSGEHSPTHVFVRKPAGAAAG